MPKIRAFHTAQKSLLEFSFHLRIFNAREIFQRETGTTLAAKGATSASPWQRDNRGSLRLSIEIDCSFVYIRRIGAGVSSLSRKDGIASHSLDRAGTGFLLALPQRKDHAYVF